MSSSSLVSPQEKGREVTYPFCSEDDPAERLVFERELGQGSFGLVHLAEDKVLGKQVAVKVITKSSIATVKSERQFRKEVTALLRLSNPGHPNIIGLYTVLEDENNLYMILEYASHGELFDYIVDNSPLDEVHAAYFFHGMVSATLACHLSGVVHRDLKPENFLLDRGKYVRLSDFGFAGFQSRGSGRTLKQPCGSPTYAAPEIFRGESYDESVDVWSLGVNLYVLVTGRSPWGDRASPRVTRERIQAAAMNPLPLSVSAECQDLIAQMVVTDAKARPALEDVLAHPFFARAMRESAGRSGDAFAARLSSLESAGNTAQVDERELIERVAQQKPSPAEIVVPRPPGRPTSGVATGKESLHTSIPGRASRSRGGDDDDDDDSRPARRAVRSSTMSAAPAQVPAPARNSPESDPRDDGQYQANHPHQDRQHRPLSHKLFASSPGRSAPSNGCDSAPARRPMRRTYTESAGVSSSAATRATVLREEEAEHQPAMRERAHSVAVPPSLPAPPARARSNSLRARAVSRASGNSDPDERAAATVAATGGGGAASSADVASSDRPSRRHSMSPTASGTTPPRSTSFVMRRPQSGNTSPSTAASMIAQQGSPMSPSPLSSSPPKYKDLAPAYRSAPSPLRGVAAARAANGSIKSAVRNSSTLSSPPLSPTRSSSPPAAESAKGFSGDISLPAIDASSSSTVGQPK